MNAIYPPNQIKRRRSTKQEMRGRYSALYAIVAEMKPMTVRQVYYQAVVRGIVDKTESGYDKVQTALVTLRRTGMPYGWIADNTRWQRKPDTYNSPSDAVEEVAKFYRKALWRDINAYVEVWVEKDALAGVMVPITSYYDVPLMVARGYSSLSFLHSAAEYIKQVDKPCFIYHFGDFDPSGVNAADKIEETLYELAPDAEIHFARRAVLEHQIEYLNLQTRETKKSDSRSKNFGDISVELDAIAPDMLRSMVRAVIQQHIPDGHLDVLKAAEESERQMLTSWAERLAAGGAA